MDSTSRIFVAGHRGLVGSALVRCLTRHGFVNVVTRSRSELDLLDQARVHAFFADERIDYVFLSAAKVGGILFNQECQADFLAPKPHDLGQRHPCIGRVRRQEAALSRELLHLPQTRTAADP